MSEKNFDALQTEVEDLKKQLSNLTKNIIPELESKITSSGSSSSGENWVEIYNKESEDESLNWGMTDGIQGADGLLEQMPPVAEISKLRIKFFATTVCVTIQTIDVSFSPTTGIFFLEGYTNDYSRVYHFALPVYNSSQNSDGKPRIGFGNVYAYNFLNGKTVSVSKYNQNSVIYIAKIEMIAKTTT